MRTRSGGEGGNCIAVVSGAQLAEQNLPPLAGFGGSDGELERRRAEDGSAAGQPPAQRGEFGALGPAEPALEADAEVVGADREVAGRALVRTRYAQRMNLPWHLPCFCGA